MSNLQWFRLYHRIIDDEKIRLLAFEDRWHFIAVCCLKTDGLLDEPDSDLKWRKVAVKMGVQLRELDEIKRRLFEVGLVDQDMQPVAWDALQYTAERKQQERHRERREEAGLPRRRWVNPGVRARVYERDGHSCVYCGSSENLTLDHVVSELKGGSNDESNLVAACRQCNARKREFTIEQAGMSYRPGYTPPAKQGPSKALASTDTDTDTEISSLRSDDRRTPRQELETVLDSEHASDVIEHRQRLRKPLTAKAAKLLARQLAQCPDPNAAADLMIERGWLAVKPDWVRNAQQPRGSPGRAERIDHFKEFAERISGQTGNSTGERGDWVDAESVPVLTIEHQR